MTEFTVKLAGHVIGVTAGYESTREFCREYLCEEKPEFSVEILPSDIDFERQKSEKEDRMEGIPARRFPDAYLETLAVYRKIAKWMLEQDTMLFHGSAIAVDGVGYLFTAKSGTGKSTHTRLWRQMLGDRAVMINDDKPLLKVTDRGVLVCGTPWNGKHRLGTDASVPLKAICVLQRGQENEICPISAKEALPVLLQQSYRPGDGVAMGQLLGLLDRLTKSVKFYRLCCNMEPQAAAVAYEAMSHGGENRENEGISYE